MEKIKNFLIRLWLFNRNFEFKRLSKWLKVALDKRMDRWNSMSDIEKKAWLDSSSDKFISFAWNLYILLKDFFYVYDLRKR